VAEWTDDEIEKIKRLVSEAEQIEELLTADTRRKWLVSSIGGAARWIALVIGAWLALKGFIAEALPWAK